MSYAIKVKNLKKYFWLFEKDYKIFAWLFTKKGHSGVKKAIDDVSFVVKPGEVVGLIGSNGAGKSTLMRVVSGITLPTEGDIRVNGKVGSFINLSAGFNVEYTGRQNLYYKGTLMGMSKKELDNKIDEIIDFIDIGNYIDMPVRTYSSGMAARLGFALAIFSDPDVLVIDEVFAVGDQDFRKKSAEKSKELFLAGKSILFSSHTDSLIREFCHRVIYLKDGNIVFNGDVEEGLKMYNEDIKKRKLKRLSKEKKD
ncbi:MAG: ABC transporter ATP-binding protein [Firmicutes bacterium]|nr:ABC transporter ATP-binding protein [Bacillota bacterium]